MLDYPDGYSERFDSDPWPHYGDPRDGTYGQVPIIDGTTVRPDVMTDRDDLLAQRARARADRCEYTVCAGGGGVAGARPRVAEHHGHRGGVQPPVRHRHDRR